MRLIVDGAQLKVVTDEEANGRGWELDATHTAILEEALACANGHRDEPTEDRQSC